MKTKLLLLLLVASVAGNVAFVVTTALARRQHGTLPMDRLGLDANQRSKLMAEREHFVAERGRAHSRMIGLRSALADEIAKPTPDRARMLQLSEEMAAIQSEMRPKFIAHLLDMHGLLRPEQRAELGEILRAGGGPGMPAGCPGAALYPMSAPSEAR
jgi:Spy/CpxP family protein refolding chaperone